VGAPIPVVPGAGGSRTTGSKPTISPHGKTVSDYAGLSPAPWFGLPICDPNPATCDGTPFNFHPEYNTARQQNQVPWAALEGGVLMEQEMGHFEPCSSITNTYPYTASFPDGQSFSDPDTAQTCVGGFEGRGKVSEGPL
jgi:hypothetical protein